MSDIRPIDMTDDNHMMKAILWTDIANSTGQRVGASTDAWRHLWSAFYNLSEELVRRYGGDDIERKGDATLSIFEFPNQAIDCAIEVRADVQVLHLEVRIGLHFGMVERAPGGIDGLAVHFAARVVEVAGAGEIIVSKLVRDLMLESRIRFEDRGLFKLKGIPEEQRLYAIAS
jgi:class 3 adenylate cyclase